MIVVTGGAGFIGSNLALGLNTRGHRDILIVDNLENGIKFRNLRDCQIADYLDKRTFLDRLQAGRFDNAAIDAVFHQGACSTTTEWNGRYMMENNYEYSKIILDFCARKQIPLIYASSAAVYGCGSVFREDPAHEAPLNIYGYSKHRFDQYIRERIRKIDSQVVGLRYFNVYGPREAHKGGMASVAFHLNQQLLETGKIALFEGCDGYANGEQRRDFIYVEDVVDVNLWFYEHRELSGLFNVGTGRSQPFNDVARAVIEFHGRGELEYIPFPDRLKGAYQSFTEANLSALRTAGYEHSFKSVEEGVRLYMQWLNP
ncbi:MAG: ADP-glyceromanno-heptose 6-epimerase [Methylococcaceae bacterium]|nr:ADP-glyceromanno-heptose 6-epimerase [Methylococcaceae bacterium]MCI0668456.1 ADP-glyceromanno-heptose 6-epimerase [Methylococcaceae bacterium]MCI0734414.1 ADP-glyceromanno-heptose 6-epimerase [Methylococcaceae bacterium]